jgi:cell division protein ZapA
MAQVTVTLNGRTYRLRCADGEEERLHDLVDHIRNKLDDLTARFGQIGSERLLLMAAILISDELFDARERGGVDKGEAA